MTLAYLDSSALVKLVLDEADTGAMRRWYVEADRMACSIIGTVETRRAVARKANGRERVDLILRSVITLDVDEAIAANASRIVPVAMRTLDAIHLATALAIGSELDSFVTYDDRLADAARAAGLPVVRPA